MFKMFFVSIIALILNSNAFALSAGTISIQQILEGVNEGQKAQGELKKEFESRQVKLKKMEDDTKKMYEELKKQSSVLNEKALRQKERDIQMKMAEVQKTTQQYQKEIKDLEENLKQPILEKVQKIIQEISESEKLDITFEKSTAPIVYLKSENDITQKVIDAYNKKFK